VIVVVGGNVKLVNYKITCCAINHYHVV